METLYILLNNFFIFRYFDFFIFRYFDFFIFRYFDFFIFRYFDFDLNLKEKEPLLCKLLALKANDIDIAPEDLVRQIYQAVSEMKESLSRDKLLN